LAICEKWKVYRELGTLRQNGEMATECLESGDLASLLKLDPAPAGCPLTVELESVTVNDKKEIQKSELLAMTYPGDALDDLESLFVPAVEEVEPVTPRKSADDY
jgi:hypothetical protein